MDIPIGEVSWVDSLIFDDERDYALIADVEMFRYLTIEHDDLYSTILDFTASKIGWVQYDVTGDQDSTGNHCVVIGRTEGNDYGEKDCYVLIVLPTEEEGEYKMVWVGMIQSGHVEKLGAHMRTV